MAGGGESMNENLALRGSQRWLQLVVNRRPEIIDKAIAREAGLEDGETIEWLSALESDCFAEYRDHAFLKRLGTSPECQRLVDFWPKRGPVWDGLARTNRCRYLLIEAKANIPEFNSSPTEASGESLHKIRKALDETRCFLKVHSRTDWSKCFYQYANRLAHLYFLKKLNGIKAALVFVFFVGDTTLVPERDPATRDDWQTAISLANHHLVIRAHRKWIRKNVADVFIDVGDLDDIPWP